MQRHGVGRFIDDLEQCLPAVAGSRSTTATRLTSTRLLSASPPYYPSSLTANFDCPLQCGVPKLSPNIGFGTLPHQSGDDVRGATTDGDVQGRLAHVTWRVGIRSGRKKKLHAR